MASIASKVFRGPLPAVGHSSADKELACHPPDDHNNGPYASFLVTLPALAGLTSARIAVLQEPSMAAYAAMAIVASEFFARRFFRDFAGAFSEAVLTAKPVVSFFACPFAFSPTMAPAWSRNLASCLSPSMTDFPHCDCGTSAGTLRLPCPLGSHFHVRALLQRAFHPTTFRKRSMLREAWSSVPHSTLSTISCGIERRMDTRNATLAKSPPICHTRYPCPAVKPSSKRC